MEHTDLEPDKGMMRRIEGFTKMKVKEKEYVCAMPDTFIATTRMQVFLIKEMTHYAFYNVARILTELPLP